MRQFAAAAILLAALILLFVMPRDMIRRALGSLRISNNVANSGDQEDITKLKADLQTAQALLDAYPAGAFSKPSGEGIHAVVYAAYPLNYQQDLLIGGGEAAGIKAGNIVLLQDSGTLLGRVEEVFKNTARVRTVFDPSWRSAARIGTSSVDALLEGGVTPRLTLIPKEATFLPGDSVYNADQQFPYGLSLGVTGAVNDVSGGVFKEAVLAVPYDINTVRIVSVFPHAE